MCLNIDWQKFRDWLFREYRRFTAIDRFRYAKKYVYCLANGDLADLRMLSDSVRSHALKGLTTLSKYLGIYENFRMLAKNYGLKYSDRNTDELIISRLLKNVDTQTIYDWLHQVKAKVPEITDFADLMLTTGLRYIEAIEAYNLIIKLNREGKLSQYYKEDREVLEHFRFKDIFIRNSKKAFISFVPKSLVHRIAENIEILDYNKVKRVVEYRVGKLRFADIRELHGTLATEHLRESEIDFLHGRVSSSVFMRNYFNPNWINDLKTRAFKSIEKTVKSARSDLNEARH